jgi:hypothetical protein
VVGTPRSGTGMLAWKMAQHPDVARITQVTKKTAGSLLLTRALMLFRRDHTDTEGGRVWGKFCSGDHEALGREDATPRARRYLRRVVRNHLKIFHKSRFLGKCPANSLRVEFLDEIFPDAIFLHIIRDGRAVTRSVYRSFHKHDGYWGLRFPGWRELERRPWLEAAALQWKTGVQYIRRSAEDLPPERYHEVKYEEFCAAPFETLEALSERCGLRWEPDELQRVTSDVQNRNFKWQEEFDERQKTQIGDLLNGFLAELGYEV